MLSVWFNKHLMTDTISVGEILRFWDHTMTPLVTDEDLGHLTWAPCCGAAVAAGSAGAEPGRSSGSCPRPSWAVEQQGAIQQSHRWGPALLSGGTTWRDQVWCQWPGKVLITSIKSGLAQAEHFLFLLISIYPTYKINVVYFTRTDSVFI